MGRKKTTGAPATAGAPAPCPAQWAPAQHAHGLCPCPFTVATAGQYLADHATDRKRWQRMSAASQTDMIENLAEQQWLLNGPAEWTRDERLAWLVTQVYPRLAEARELHMSHIGGPR